MSDKKRVGVGPKLRFEVFKRDKFTCQYCGEKAPAVVLNCDHINPVALGGGAEIGNLITSCRACNGGKGAVPLSDSSVIDRQHASLAELEERRQQLEMMMQWRDELQDLQSDTVEMVSSRIQERTGLGLNDNGKNGVRRWLRRFTLAEVMNAADEAIDQYVRFGADGKATVDTWEQAISKIPGIVGVKRQELERPYLRRLFYIQGILKNRGRASRLDWIDYLEHIHLTGLSLDDMEREAKRCSSLREFSDHFDAWLADMGRPF